MKFEDELILKAWHGEIKFLHYLLGSKEVTA